jgi:hypothetical protein
MSRHDRSFIQNYWTLINTFFTKKKSLVLSIILNLILVGMFKYEIILYPESLKIEMVF